MGESNGEWGGLEDDEFAEAWDSYASLPAPGENEVLDAFLASKNLTISALAKLGTRMVDDETLVFAYHGGLKYRNIVTGRRYNYLGSEFTKMRIVPAGPSRSDTVIVAEGETDGARLTMLYPQADIAVLPAGAKVQSNLKSFADQLSVYEKVYVGLDDDEAGNEGAARIIKAVPGSVRLKPSGNDWCDSEGPTPLPEVQPYRLWVNARELAEMEQPEIISWFDNAILPIGGQMIIHGWVKSFKSFMAQDIASAIAQGREWCGFLPTEEPAKVMMVQYEITAPFYAERVENLRAAAEHPDEFDENFLTWEPGRRPTLRIDQRGTQERFLEGLEESGAQVVVFDPLRRMGIPGDMNRDEGSLPLLHFFERVQDLGVTVIAVHHDNKDAARHRRNDGGLSMTGSGAFSGDADTIVSITLPRGESYDTSTIRNVSFTMRNAPSPGTKGFRILESGTLSYQDEPFSTADDGTAEAEEPGI